MGYKTDKTPNGTVTIVANTIPTTESPLSFTSTPTIPIKFTSSNSYLIGKRVNRDIVSLNGELIIRKNAIITAKTLNLAKHFNKLKELVTFAYQ